MSGEGTTVCVTGASGYIASWIIKLLLERGYTVRATLRDPNDPRKTGHLFALAGAKEKLHLFKADLGDEGSWDPVVHGCQVVFHVASPVLFRSSDPQAEIIDPAVKGTLSILKACAEAPSIRRVVLTSSLATALFSSRPLASGDVIDETCFSDPQFCEESQFWYILSKTLAEEAGREFAKENGIDLITIHPGMVIGPFLQPASNFSLELILDLINGENTHEIYCFIDVRDVAYAHIQAAELPSASGRYLLAERVMPLSEVLKILQDLDPSLCPKTCKEDVKPHETVKNSVVYRVSKERAKTLGVGFIPAETSMKDSIESLKELGVLK